MKLFTFACAASVVGFAVFGPVACFHPAFPVLDRIVSAGIGIALAIAGELAGRSQASAE